MAHFRASFETPRAIDDAFAYLAEFSHTADWDPGVARAERRDAGPLRVGSEFDVVARFLGREVPLRYRIVQLDPPGRVVLEAETDALHAVDAITCEKRDAGTRVTWDATLHLRGWRYLADLPLHAAFQWVGRRALDGLRRALG